MALSSIEKRKILQEYDQRAEEIIKKMFQILVRAQKKIENKAYQDVLNKV